MKKRGFGKGHWNGTGGKFDTGKDKNIKSTAIRETEEEIDVVPKNLKKVALLHFYFTNDPKKKNWNQDVHVFLSRNWVGEPVETEEMKPEWFKYKNIPYDQMWDDDNLWFPKVLGGEKLECWFWFDNNNKVTTWKSKKL